MQVRYTYFHVYILATTLNIIVTYITYVYSVYIYDFATWEKMSCDYSQLLLLCYYETIYI